MVVERDRSLHAGLTLQVASHVGNKIYGHAVCKDVGKDLRDTRAPARVCLDEKKSRIGLVENMRFK